MKNPFLMAHCKSFECHLHVRFDVCRRENNIPVSYDSFQITLHEFKHKVQVPLVGININEFNDVGVMELLEKLYLPQSRDIHPFLVLSQPYFLHRYSSVCLERETDKDSKHMKNKNWHKKSV